MAKYTLEYDKDKLSDNVVALVKSGVKDTCKSSDDHLVWVNAFNDGLEAIHSAAAVFHEKENSVEENKQALNKMIESYGDSTSLKDALKKLG